MTLKGPVFAILTPFDARGDVDYAALDDYLGFLSSQGVPSIVVNGTTGEFSSLTLPERKAILERCRKTFKGTIVSHISSCSHRECLDLLSHSGDFADAVLLLPPYYYADVDEAGGLAFMSAVLERCTLPAYLYNFPEHTQFRINPKMLATLAERFECLAGIKDSGGDLATSTAYKQGAARLQVFVGSDRWALEVLKSGLDGSVTGCANPVPEFLVGLAAQFAAGDLEGARRTQSVFDKWTSFREQVPVNQLALTKAAMEARVPGFPAYMRPPFVTVDEERARQIRSAVLSHVRGS
jgi:4-hydroxy-tetrahydrodipicolinate synthase